MDIINAIIGRPVRGALIFATGFEIAAIFIVMVIAVLMPGLGSRYFGSAERTLRRLGRHRNFSIGLSGALGLILAIGISLFVRIPEPRVHDEFSYLLAADTFAQGRVTNPTHPLWVHFESMHIIHQPSYASKYPPGQGLVMALGQVIGGHPIVGVWVSTALASAVICWMLFAWLPGHWALLGGMLAALHPTMLGWSQNYWGGAVAVIGGALLLGGFRRIVTVPRSRDAFLMGLGIVLLASSRPYEGLALTLLPAGYLVRWLMRNTRPGLGLLLKRVVLPSLAVILVGAGVMGYYNSRVTGDPFRMPYQVHEATYSVMPNFIWQTPRVPPPAYNHAELARFHVKEYGERSLSDWLKFFRWKTANFIKAFFRPLVLVLPLLMIPWVVRYDWWMRIVLFALALVVAANFSATYSWPHYIAPAMGLVFLLVLQGMRHMRLCCWFGRPTGAFLVRASVLLWFVSLLTTYLYQSSVGIASEEYWALHRAQILRELEQDGASHLIIVRYEPPHNPDHEWVYNRADIDGSKVVWAREMSSMEELLEHFKDRQMWLLEADAKPPTLVRYEDEGAVQKGRDEALGDYAGVQ